MEGTEQDSQHEQQRGSARAAWVFEVVGDWHEEQRRAWIPVDFVQVQERSQHISDYSSFLVREWRRMTPAACCEHAHTCVSSCSALRGLCTCRATSAVLRAVGMAVCWPFAVPSEMSRCPAFGGHQHCVCYCTKQLGPVPRGCWQWPRCPW